jgi:acyl dehydratase
MIYFEDIEVGTKTSFGRYEVTREEVLAFAEKYDPQPFHLSDEAAAQTHFGRLAASGWHTCSMTMAMVVENMKANPSAGLGAAGVDELRWLKPVFPGDVLRVETEVLEKRASASRPDMGSFLNQTTVFNQNDEPVMRFTARALMGRRPA